MTESLTRLTRLAFELQVREMEEAGLIEHGVLTMKDLRWYVVLKNVFDSMNDEQAFNEALRNQVRIDEIPCATASREQGDFMTKDLENLLEQAWRDANGDPIATVKFMRDRKPGLGLREAAEHMSRMKGVELKRVN
jgi:hypothetical protein